MKIHRRPRFSLDLAEELTWLNKKAGPDVAERFFEAVRLTIGELRKQPRVGRERRDLRPAGIRSWRIKGFPRWLLFYMVDQDALILLRLRQGAMDLPNLRMKS
jgi:toxin ParE1/3/4